MTQWARLGDNYRHDYFRHRSAIVQTVTQTDITWFILHSAYRQRLWKETLQTVLTVGASEHGSGAEG